MIYCNARRRSPRVSTGLNLQVTNDDARPAVETVAPTASREAQHYLDDDALSDLDSSRSGRVSETDLSKLADELGIAPGATEATAAASEVRDGESMPDRGGKSNGGDGEAHGGTANIGVPDSGERSGSAVSANFNGQSTKASGSASASAAAGTAAVDSMAGTGGERQDASPGKSKKASFDGYDFNTFRKVGAHGVGRTDQGLPQLASRRSADFATGQP